MLGNVRASAVNRGGKKDHRILLTPEQIERQWKVQEGRCFWLGIKLDLKNVGKTHCLVAPSIDRLHNKWGYFPSNIVIASRFANLGRIGMDAKIFARQVKALRKAMYGDMWPRFLFDEKLKASRPGYIAAEQFELPVIADDASQSLLDGEEHNHAGSSQLDTELPRLPELDKHTHAARGAPR